MKDIDGKDMNVLGETLEKAKKGLECCSKNALDPCIGCPYERTENAEWKCGLNADALALIQQFEEALLLMVYQYCSEDDGYVSHRWMTAGEHAFAALGIENYCSIETISKRLDEMEGIHKTPLPEPPKEEGK